MEHKVQTQRTKVQEGGDEPPVLPLAPDGGEAVEELEGRHNLALNQHRGDDARSRPQPCHNRYVIVPLLECCAVGHGGGGRRRRRWKWRFGGGGDGEKEEEEWEELRLLLLLLLLMLVLLLRNDEEAGGGGGSGVFGGVDLETGSTTGSSNF